MAVTNSSNDGQLKTFKTFPEFSKLTFDDRKRYESLIAEYPPISSYSFAGLKLWWDPLGSCAVSQFNDNLVLSYWWPGNEKLTGLSVVGTSRLDETICAIFDHMKAKGDQARLVHVPEFMLAHLEHPELFALKEERDVNEYIYEVSRFYPMDHMVGYRKLRVRRFLSDISEDRIMLKSLDLSRPDNQQLLLNCPWPNKGINKLGKMFDEAWTDTITHADLLGMENVCLYIDGELRAFMLYFVPADRRYIIFRHAKVDYGIPRIFDYMVYAFSGWLADRRVMYINLNSDIGLPFLRMLMVTLGPVNYFRLYAVTPA